LLQCSPRDFFCFFIMIFFKIIFVDFIFLILSWLRIIITIRLNHVGNTLNFHYKTLWIAKLFPYMVFFCYDFFQNYFCRFYQEKHCSFHHKTLWIVTVFSLMVFFVFLNYLCRFFFNIKLVKNLTLYFFFLFINRKAKSSSEKLNHVRKTLNVFS